MPPPSQPTPHHTPAHTATVSPLHTPSPRHSHATLSNSPTPATPPHGLNLTAQLPHVVQTPGHWDNRQVLNLPRHIQPTAHSAHNRTAGLPVESVPLLAFLRHSWSSYWLRYIAHGHEPHIVCTKHVNEAVFATELLGMLRARRIDIDQAAAAYCWEDKLNLAKRPALTQLSQTTSQQKSTPRRNNNPEKTPASKTTRRQAYKPTSLQTQPTSTAMPRHGQQHLDATPVQTHDPPNPSTQREPSSSPFRQHPHQHSPRNKTLPLPHRAYRSPN